MRTVYVVKQRLYMAIGYMRAFASRRVPPLSSFAVRSL